MMNKKNKNPSKQPIIEEMANSIKRDAILKKDLQLLYMFSMDTIEKEIQAFIARYEKKGINVSELKKRVTVDEIAVLKRRIEQYLQQKKKTTGGTLQLDQFNALNTLSRLELLQYQIDLAMLELTDGEHRIADKFLQQEFLKGLEVSAQSIGANVMSANQLAISMNTIIHEDFKGQKWSSNIWKNKEALRKEVSIVVAHSLLRGKNPIVAVNKIRDLFKTSEYESRRLLITEGTRVNANAQVAVMKANGYDYCEIVPESNACGICKPLANRPIKIDDAVSGENIPPFHPHCKCGLVASVREEAENIVLSQIDLHNNVQEAIIKEYPFFDKKGIILLKERYNHILDGHSDIGENVIDSIEKVIKSPIFILKDHKNKNSVLFIGQDSKNNINVVVRLSTNSKYSNSIITAMRVSDKTIKRLIRKNVEIYRKK